MPNNFKNMYRFFYHIIFRIAFFLWLFRMSFPFPCSVGSFSYYCACSLGLVASENLLLELQMDGSLIWSALSKDCFSVSSLSSLEWNGISSFPDSLTLAWKIPDLWVYNCHLLHILTLQPCPQTHFPPLHTNTLYVWRSHLPGFTIFYLLVPNIDLLFSWELWSLTGYRKEIRWKVWRRRNKYNSPHASWMAASTHKRDHCLVSCGYRTHIFLCSSRLCGRWTTYMF